jgi:hypothetical protein
MFLQFETMLEKKIYISIRVIHKKSCFLGPKLHPSFDASFPFSCCPQSHKILLNKGMKCRNLGLNAR